MKRLFYFFILPLIFAFTSAENFKSLQLKYERVQESYTEKEELLKQLYQEKGLNFSHQNLFIRVFKEEDELEVWARTESKGKYIHVKTFKICAKSGNLGPKRKKGDGQTPEGFYHIDRFNPQSDFYLSLGINYPNASDKFFAQGDAGGDIFIHGNCVTIGCIPLRNNFIKEVYIMAVEARNIGQTRIPVHIFPFRMTEENFNSKKSTYASDKTLLAFWKNIKAGYDYFEKANKLPTITVDETGKYKFQ